MMLIRKKLEQGGELEERRGGVYLVSELVGESREEEERRKVDKRNNT